MRINEVIQNPPRHIFWYTKMRIKDLHAFTAEITEIASLYKESKQEMNTIINEMHRYCDNDENPSWAESLINRLTGEYDNLNSLIGNLESFIQYPTTTNWFGYYLDGLKIRMEHYHLDWILALAPKIAPTEQYLDDGGYFDPKYADPVELKALHSGIEFFKRIVSFAQKFTVFAEDTKAKYTEFMRPKEYQGNPVKPNHDDVETLYHTSLYASEIAEKGFEPSTPKDRVGLGRAEENVISFTHDLYTAKEIRRCFIEMWMIANGELKFNQILDWAKRDGHYDRTDVKTRKEYIRHTNDPIADTARLYQFYIYFRDPEMIRTNPVIMNLESTVQKLIGHPKESIGILACEVRLNQKEIYRSTVEKEFRVPPSQVISIKRIL